MKQTLTTIICSLVCCTLWAHKPIQQTTIDYYGTEYQGTTLKIEVVEGAAHSYPLFAIWMESLDGQFIQTLYISKSVGKGIYHRAKRQLKRWEEGFIYRPASLPYYSHRRNELNEFNGYLPTPEHPTPDAYTGATPKHNFEIFTTTKLPLNGTYRIFMEINQPLDWNDFWHNNKYPGNKEYMTSSQPAVVYEAIINSFDKDKPIPFKPIGHSHFAGETGDIFPDITTLTTALQIIKTATITVIKP